MRDSAMDKFEIIAEQMRMDSLTERQALEELIIDNPDLERIESLLDEFNIFEAIGMVQQEIRHSTFLAFLLDPNQNHGMGDAFLKRLLQKVLAGTQTAALPVSLIDLDIWSFDDSAVFCERHNIDILLLNETHKLAIILENKIYSGEHSDQLERYFQSVETQYPEYRIFGIFLTPEGIQPTDERYLSASYKQVAEVAENFVERYASIMGAEIRSLMKHYAQMLRRHIVSDSEIEVLCQRIYRKHKRALDLILEHRPDRQAEISEALAAMIKDTPGMILDTEKKGYMIFAPEEWETPRLKEGAGWIPSNRMLVFGIENLPNKLYLRLLIGPGPEPTRKRLLDMACAKKPPFKPFTSKLNAKWNQIFIHGWLDQKDMEVEDIALLTAEIHKRWAHFRTHQLPALLEAVRAETWIWEEESMPQE